MKIYKGSDNKIKTIALMGLLVALAIILSYVESLVPAFFAVPGMKLGLTNIVVLFAIYRLDLKSAIIINLIRIMLVGFMFGSGVSIIYSVCGGILSFLVMAACYKLLKLKIITVSVCGGVFHNVGQVIAAAVLLSTVHVMGYFVILWFSGVAAGIVTGIIAAVIVKRIPENIILNQQA